MKKRETRCLLNQDAFDTQTQAETGRGGGRRNRKRKTWTVLKSGKSLKCLERKGKGEEYFGEDAKGGPTVSLVENRVKISKGGYPGKGQKYQKRKGRDIE